MTSREREALLQKVQKDARRIADHFGLHFKAILAEHPKVKSRYGVCYADGLIKIRLNHARTGEPLRYSSLIDTLCHELAHLKHFNHGPDFRRFFFRILRWARRQGIYRPRKTPSMTAPSSPYSSISRSPDFRYTGPANRNGVPIFAELDTQTELTPLPWESPSPAPSTPPLKVALTRKTAPSAPSAKATLTRKTAPSAPSAKATLTRKTAPPTPPTLSAPSAKATLTRKTAPHALPLQPPLPWDAATPSPPPKKAAPSAKATLTRKTAPHALPLQPPLPWDAATPSPPPKKPFPRLMQADSTVLTVPAKALMGSNAQKSKRRKPEQLSLF